MAGRLKARFGWWLERFLWAPLARRVYGEVFGSGWHTVKTYLVWQKVFRINGPVPWLVHPSSVVTNWQKIRMKKRFSPGVSPGCYIQAGNGIEFGENVLIGPNVGIVSANHDPLDFRRWIRAEPVRIGDNVWIAMNSVVLPGVTIGDNVVIGAGSVVRTDIPSNSIAAGNPCRVLRAHPAAAAGGGGGPSMAGPAASVPEAAGS